MTSGAIRVPPPSRPSKKQGLFIHTHLTPRHSRQPEPAETAYSQLETETDSTNSSSRTLPELPTTSMDLLATFAANSTADAPLSPPRSMLDLLRDADTSDPSVLSPREASDPSSPVSSYQVPASFQLHHRHSSGSKRSRTSVSEKENSHNINTSVTQLFSSRRNGNGNASVNAYKDDSDAVPYDWTVNVDQLSSEKQAKLYWNLCYGGGDTSSPTDTCGTKMNASNTLQDSWSARRQPPPKGWYVYNFSFWIASRLY
jgi:hypothetical protein